MCLIHSQKSMDKLRGKLSKYKHLTCYKIFKIRNKKICSIYQDNYLYKDGINFAKVNFSLFYYNKDGSKQIYNSYILPEDNDEIYYGFHSFLSIKQALEQIKKPNWNFKYLPIEISSKSIFGASQKGEIVSTTLTIPKYKLSGNEADYTYDWWMNRLYWHGKKK